MALTPEEQAQIQAPDNIPAKPQDEVTAPVQPTAETQTPVSTPSNLTSEAQADISTPANLTSQSQGSVSTPANIAAKTQGDISAPVNVTAKPQGDITAPSALGTIAQQPINPPTPPRTLDLNFAKESYQIAGKRGELTDLIDFTRATTGTYYGRDLNQWGQWEYSLKTAAVDEPRLEFDPVTGEALGILIEGASTNLLPYSEEFNGAAWVKSGGASVIKDEVSAPDGSLSADKLTFDAINSRIEQVVAVISGQGYEFSVFMMAGSRDSVTMGVAGDQLEAVELTSRWQRYVFSGTATGSLLFPSIRVSDASNGYIYIWGAQLEAKPYPTSYIKTEASQVTRAADIATSTDLSPWMNFNEGAFYANANIGAAGVTSYIFDTRDGAFLNGIGALESGGVVSAVCRASTTTAVVNIGSGEKVALSYVSGLLNGSVGGSYISEVRDFNQGGTALYMGATGGISQQRVHIKQLAYYPAALNESQLKGLTK